MNDIRIISTYTPPPNLPPIRRPGSTELPAIIVVQVQPQAQPKRRLEPADVEAYWIIAASAILTTFIVALVCVGPFALIYALAAKGL